MSVEPSKVLLDEFSDKSDYQFPEYVRFVNADIFDLDPSEMGLFDTIFFIHVLEHIKDDRAALDHVFGFLKNDSHVLIQVPALPFLYSDHDEAVGHYRRYTRKMLKSAVDEEKYRIKKMWYNDPIGVLGSLFFFKFRKLKLNSSKGISAVENQGMIYDKYLIPVQSKIERFVKFPFGLSLTAVLEKRSH